MLLSLPSFAADVVMVSASAPQPTDAVASPPAALSDASTPGSAASEPAAASAPPAVAEPASRHWYGWQTLLADVPSLGLISVWGLGFLSYPLGAPIVHAAHGRWAMAGIDAGVRIVVPLLSG